MNMTDQEKAIIEIVRLNKATKKDEIRIERRVGRLHMVFSWKSKKNFWGRFGGGWNWELGFVAGGRTVILNLLICSLRIEVIRKEEVNA